MKIERLKVLLHHSIICLLDERIITEENEAKIFLKEELGMTEEEYNEIFEILEIK